MKNTMNNKPELNKIGVIFRPVHDLDQSREFYGNKLGLQEQWRAPDGATAFSTGSGPIIILFDKKSDESKAQFNFETDDISRAYRSMKSSGIEVSDIRIAANTSMFFFDDLDGNTMMIWACHMPDSDLPQYRVE